MTGIMQWLLMSYKNAKSFQVDTNGTLTTSLVSYYKMEDATDYFSTNNGTNNSVTFSAWKVNNAGVFNGTSSNINISDDSALRITGNYSIAFWLNRNASTATQRLVNKDNANDFSWWYSFYIINNQLWWSHNTNQWNTNWDSIATLTSGSWVHYIFIYDWVNQTVFRDWTQLAQRAKTVNLIWESTNNLFIWAYWDTTALWQYLNWNIDEIWIWSKALSSQERTDLYNTGSGQTMV